MGCIWKSKTHGKTILIGENENEGENNQTQKDAKALSIRGRVRAGQVIVEKEELGWDLAEFSVEQVVGQIAGHC